MEEKGFENCSKEKLGVFGIKETRKTSMSTTRVSSSKKKRSKEAKTVQKGG